MTIQTGDKVRLKTGSDRGKRGSIEASDGPKLIIRLDGTGRTVRALVSEVTNYSLAARKAWVTDPERPVGRRKGTRLTDRVSVTLPLTENYGSGSFRWK